MSTIGFLINVVYVCFCAYVTVVLLLQVYTLVQNIRRKEMDEARAHMRGLLVFGLLYVVFIYPAYNFETNVVKHVNEIVDYLSQFNLFS